MYLPKPVLNSVLYFGNWISASLQQACPSDIIYHFSFYIPGFSVMFFL